MQRSTLLFLLSFIAALASSAIFVSAGNFSTVAGTGYLIDHDAGNLHRLFRGVNMVRKGAGAWQVQPAEIALLKKLGMNVVRYGVIWTNVEPEPGKYNQTYLLDVRRNIDLLFQNGIYSFIDLHQDLLSPFSCSGEYDGMPTFYLQPPNTSDFWKGGKYAYPAPFAKPSYLPDPAGAFGPWGNPVCSWSSQWAESYATIASCKMWGSFYNNGNGVQDRFADMWAAISQVVIQNNPAVIGSEILNEPWFGDLYSDPALLLGGVADRKNLVPLYARVAKRLRELVPEVPVMMSAITGGSLVDGTIGFTPDNLPGGPALAKSNIFSFHLYCPLLQADVPNPDSSDAIVRFIELTLCNIVDGLDLTNRGMQAKMLGTGAFLTEFGSIPYNAAAANMMQVLTRNTDAALFSYTFWEMGGLLHAPENIQNSIARSYPRAVPGRVLSFKSERNVSLAGQRANHFRTEYILNDNIVLGQVAEIQMTRYDFPVGSVSIAVYPKSVVIGVNSTKNTILLRHDGLSGGTPVVLEVTMLL